ncbi:hypothetical protein GE09DRAFT_563609 [Coniochaeta sp. 2T2.1]|nr:hypothetical protein GE09DRAFT_563609 [Coniochaeta sp. 2T2.1]
MHAKILTVLAAVTAVLGTPLNVARNESDAAAQLADLAQLAYNTTIEEIDETATKRALPSCSLSKLRVRREWGKLSANERKAYTKAVQCLQSKPPRTPASVAPGAKSRFDDFIVTHIQQTLNIHYTANFLTWHRYFIWAYEEALRNECGYTGTQPFWDWGLTAITGLERSPIFDGSATSMGSNGAYAGPRPDYILGLSTGLPPLYLPAGTGGGCVTTGPFKDMKVNLGPVAEDQPGGVVEGQGPGTGLTYNPRCLKRDLKSPVNKKSCNYEMILHNVLVPRTVNDFQMELQGIPGSGVLGCHGAGHYSFGASPGADLFVSPGDPVFYLHHGQIDRAYWLWQTLHQSASKTIAGTRTLLNQPPSPDGTLDDYIDLGYAASPPRKIRDLLSTVDGPLCYVYSDF